MNEPHLSSGPYPPTTASLGGLPTVGVDVPLCGVFLALYIAAAVANMTILQVNLRRGHKFVISGMLFGFSMSRVVTMVLRIVWATRPTNLRLGIAASVFIYAGVILLFVINLIFAQRIVRAWHPNVGWHRLFHHAFTALYSLIVLTLGMLIVSVIQSFYTLNDNTKRIDRDILLYGQTFYCIISFLPIPMIVIGLLAPRKTQTEKFGKGRFRWKIVTVLTAAFLLCLGASFRVGTNYAGGTRPINDPAGYQSKACFWIFNFVVEIMVILLYVIVRIDKRFWVPDHSKKPGDYSRGYALNTENPENGDGKGSGDGERRVGDMILPEEEVFDDMSPEEVAQSTAVGSEVDVEMDPVELAQIPVTKKEVDAESSPEEVAQLPAMQKEMDPEMSPKEATQTRALEKEVDVEREELGSSHA